MCASLKTIKAFLDDCLQVSDTPRGRDFLEVRCISNCAE